MIIGIDPGETTGWAKITQDGVLLDMGQVKYNYLPEWLSQLTADDVAVFVVENFKVRPGVNFSWNEMKTIRAIGMVELRAHQLVAQVVMQEPATYTIGAKWAGITIPSDHSISHQAIAYAHATFYSVKTLGNPLPAFKNHD